MVRIKHRYLLVNILYPELDGKPIDPTLPNVVQFHQPTTDGVLERDLIRGIKEEVDFMFGDYGAGAISDSNGISTVIQFLYCAKPSSEILVTGDLDLHCPGLTRALQACMGSIVTNGSSSC